MTYIPQDVFHEIDRRLWMIPRMSLEVLAQELGVERHSIEQAMRDSAGLSFRAYREKVILLKTSHLMSINSLLSRKEIAYSLGYQSVSAFARFIKRTTGQSFTAFRRHRCAS